MAWITPTEADLLTAIPDNLLEDIRAHDLAPGQADPVASVLAQIVHHIRGKVAACADNRLGPAGTIPDELLWLCCDLAYVRLYQRANGGILTQAQQDLRTQADRALADIAACRSSVQQPDAPATESTRATRTSILRSRTQYSRSDYAGL